MQFEIRIHHSLDEFAAHQWDALAAGGNPFVRFAFLSALEKHHCVGPHAGWETYYLGAWSGGQLVGAVPMYLKYNSYGEFVFDWTWADAYRQFAGAYYPKLVVAAPYTPATGPRLLLAQQPQAEQVGRTLIQATIELAKSNKLSSLHWLFPLESEMPALEEAGLLTRIGVQYHWANSGYRDFQDYLA